MNEESEMWNQYKERKKEVKTWHQKNTTPKDKELLASLRNTHIEKIEDDGAGGEKYVIEVLTERGARMVDWWTATGLWKIRSGKAEGRGIYSMGRYFQLIPKKETSDDGSDAYAKEEGYF